MDLGLTQHTLALRLGLTYRAVAGWESGANVPLSTRWPAIEAVLGSGLVPSREGLPGQIRAARLRLGLTQQNLADRAGVHVRTVRNVEQGTFGPSPVTPARLEGVLGVSFRAGSQVADSRTL